MQTGNLKSPSQPLFGFVDRGGEGESGLLDETKPMLANEQPLQKFHDTKQ